MSQIDLTVSVKDPAASWIRVGTLDELRARENNVVVVRGADRPVAVFCHENGVSAVDNRCPHMGFPLSKGSVRDGILICHWHEARFEMSSGCTFDLFADDVPAYDVEVRANGEIFIAPYPRQGPAGEKARWERRLQEGLEQNVGLIQAKAILGLERGSAGVAYRDIVRQIALFGAANRDSWSGGMTSLTALANLAPFLSDETRYLALYQGSVRVADDCAGRPPRRAKPALTDAAVPQETLKRWLLNWTNVRHRDAAERTLATAIEAGATPEALCDMMFAAATERFYADGGHLLDFTNKAVELLDLIGWEHAAAILPLVVGQLASARGGEEQGHWRYPVDLVPEIENISSQLPDLLRSGEGKTWNDIGGLTEQLLGDDCLANLSALRTALADGALPEQVSGALACAAGLRVARFGSANEFSDWITVLHTFTYCNAIDCAVRRCPTPETLRGVLHGAAAVYFDRFLNVPPARLPGERDTDEPGAEPDDAETLLAWFRDALDGQQAGQQAVRAVALYLRRGYPVAPLFDTLTLAAVREDADFHTLQMVEAGIRQYDLWATRPEGSAFLLAVSRYLAAHSPTPRARLQTARIALRLHRGDALQKEILFDDDPHV